MNIRQVQDFKKAKEAGRRLAAVTCYDHWSADIIERSPIDCVLVGDSVAMVVHGFPSTVHATTEMMALHTAAVARGLRTKFLVADMPFLTFRKGPEAALACVEKLMQAGAHAVKLEGVRGHEATVERIVRSGVPVMGHIGLTPQSVHGLGGFRVQGRDEEDAQELREQGRLLEQLGCFSLVLECVPSALGRTITQDLRIPTIGIGAGAGTDGQILVLQDLLGLSPQGAGYIQPRFVREFMPGREPVATALRRFAAEIAEGTFPSDQEAYA